MGSDDILGTKRSSAPPVPASRSKPGGGVAQTQEVEHFGEHLAPGLLGDGERGWYVEVVE